MEAQQSLGFIEAVTKAISQYRNYEGRSRRSEYWWFCLAEILVDLILGTIFYIFQQINLSILIYIMYAVYLVCEIIIFIIGLPLAIRRLHDVGKSGWFLLLAFIPFVNLYLIYLFVCDSQKEENEYGPSPKYSGADPSNLTGAGANYQNMA